MTSVSSQSEYYPSIEGAVGKGGLALEIAELFDASSPGSGNDWPRRKAAEEAIESALVELGQEESATMIDQVHSQKEALSAKEGSVPDIRLLDRVEATLKVAYYRVFGTNNEE